MNERERPITRTRETMRRRMSPLTFGAAAMAVRRPSRFRLERRICLRRPDQRLPDRRDRRRLSGRHAPAEQLRTRGAGIQSRHLTAAG